MTNLPLWNVRTLEKQVMRCPKGLIRPGNWRVCVLFSMLILLPSVPNLVAQGSPLPVHAAGSPPQTPPVVSSSGTSGDSAAVTNDRLFFALPNFLTLENSGQVTPLTPGQKFKVVARGSFDPIQFASYGLLSGISQAEDSEPGFGQGAEGYGKRYGAALADGTIENLYDRSCSAVAFPARSPFFSRRAGRISTPGRLLGQPDRDHPHRLGTP